jgi:hypothetical protein
VVTGDGREVVEVLQSTGKLLDVVVQPEVYRRRRSTAVSSWRRKWRWKGPFLVEVAGGLGSKTVGNIEDAVLVVLPSSDDKRETWMATAMVSTCVAASGAETGMNGVKR